MKARELTPTTVHRGDGVSLEDKSPGQQAPAIQDARIHAELWVSLASLLRSYTAAHGLHGDRQATVELGEHKIMVRHGEKWLALDRNGAIVAWKRENGSGGTLELTAHGRLRGPAIEEEMDLAAEAWARGLMGEP